MEFYYFLVLNKFGKEVLLLSIARHFQEKIVVSPQRLQNYRLMGITDEYFTVDPSQGQIEVISKAEVSQKIDKTAGEWFMIEPTAQRTVNQSNYITVPLSDHCSYTELLNFVGKLRPKVLKLILPSAADKKDQVIPPEFQKLLNTSSPRKKFMIPQSVKNFMNKNKLNGSMQSSGKKLRTVRSSIESRVPVVQRRISNAKGVVFQSSSNTSSSEKNAESCDVTQTSVNSSCNGTSSSGQSPEIQPSCVPTAIQARTGTSATQKRKNSRPSDDHPACAKKAKPDSEPLFSDENPSSSDPTSNSSINTSETATRAAARSERATSLTSTSPVTVPNSSGTSHVQSGSSGTVVKSTPGDVSVNVTGRNDMLNIIMAEDSDTSSALLTPPMKKRSSTLSQKKGRTDGRNSVNEEQDTVRRISAVIRSENPPEDDAVEALEVEEVLQVTGQECFIPVFTLADWVLLEDRRCTRDTLELRSVFTHDWLEKYFPDTNKKVKVILPVNDDHVQQITCSDDHYDGWSLNVCLELNGVRGQLEWVNPELNSPASLDSNSNCFVTTALSQLSEKFSK